jgi:hypothetical protein
MPFTEKDIQEIKTAKKLLENPGIAARMTNLLGSPIEKGIEMLPDNWQEKVNNATKTAIYKALDVAVNTMDPESIGQESDDLWHKIAVAATGGIGGAFGIAALAVELPVSTTIILRSIADIARHEGEDLTDAGTQLSCLEVFAFGGPSTQDDAAETGYFAIRALLAQAMNDAAKHVAAKGVSQAGAPPIARFMLIISERFGLQVTQKIAAQMIPAIGAVGGSIINSLFIDHFQNMARGHFIIRRLERTYGYDIVKRKYNDL